VATSESPGDWHGCCGSGDRIAAPTTIGKINAMAIMTGNVTCVRVIDDGGFTQLVDAAGEKETFILWFPPATPSEVSAFERIMHSMWISLLREAHVNGLPVTIIHPDNDAIVSQVQLGEEL
jgi:hypothetical protein